MARLLVNGLSLGSLSGRHVLFGHLRQLIAWTRGEHEFVMVLQPDDRLPVDLQQPHVQTIVAPKATSHWASRWLWEAKTLPELARQQRCDVYFTPAGTVAARMPIPQVSLAQNPWCMMSTLPRTMVERGKACLQRMAYRRAYRQAELMVYNSHHMRELYGKNAQGRGERDWIVAYQGVNDDSFEAAARWRARGVERHPLRIVSVSAMAAWKGADTLVRALAELHRRGIKAELRLVGPWPDVAYEQLVRSEISRLKLERYVTLTGQVSVEQLHEEYARAMVYCLMSRCESFGIPAVEAQAFGTPVVGATGCAMPEVGGEGGVYGPPGDAEGTATMLAPLLTDAESWRERAAMALANVERFRWSECSRPLLRMFSLTSASRGSVG